MLEKIKFKKTAVEKLVQSSDFLFCFKALIAFWQKCCETEIFLCFKIMARVSHEWCVIVFIVLPGLGGEPWNF